MTNPEIKIEAASVKVMRSFDYCHFEVCLSTSFEKTYPEEIQNMPLVAAEVDELRKVAARLADRAVEQYKIAKANYAKRETESRDRQWEVNRMEAIRQKAEGDRTVREQAELKAFDDATWAASREYDYQDDWEND